MPEVSGCPSDLRQDAKRIRQHPVVGETDHSPSCQFEFGRPVCITGPNKVPFVDRAIDLHRQPEFAAREIDDEASNGVLTTEFEASKRPTFDSSPESDLGICHPAPQGPGDIAG